MATSPDAYGGTATDFLVENTDGFNYKEDIMEYEVCSCGATEDVAFTADPYQEEINGDSTMYWICGTCWRESADDI